MKKIIIWIITLLFLISCNWQDDWKYCEYKTLPCKKWLECIDSNSGKITESEWTCQKIFNQI